MLTKSIKIGIHRIKNLARLLPISEKWHAKISLLNALVQRDLQARYKGSVLGNFWSLLNQLAQLFIFTYVFSIVLQVKLNLKGLPSSNLTYGLWLFAGLISWNAFTAGFLQSANSVITQPNLVKKVVFPLELLPLVPIFSAFIESSLGLMALIVMLAVSTQTIHSTLWLLPLIWIPQLLLTIGLGYLAAGLTVFLRDIPQTIGVILNLVFYATPIIYPSSAIPEQFRVWILWLNPLAAIADFYRDIILVGEVHHWAQWGICTGMAIAVFCLGYLLYQRLRPAFADVL